MLTTPQAAERLGVSTARIRQFILEGRLPSQQFGRDHFIKESDLALVSERKAGRPRKEGAAEGQPAPLAQKPATMTEAKKKRIRDEQQARWRASVPKTKTAKKGGKK